jgi:uncharacterized protein YidB (DUF937 family)
MGIIQTMLEGLSGGHGAVTPLLARAMQGVIGTSTDEGPGIPWLLEKLQQAGYGDRVASWIGGGPDLPISAHELHAALGDEAVTSIASRAGLGPEELLGKLSEHLPAVIDRLTPDGRLPTDIHDKTHPTA